MEAKAVVTECKSKTYDGITWTIRSAPKAELNKPLLTLKPGGSFKAVTLLEGWLIVKDDGAEAGENRFKWKEREEFDVKVDR